MGKDDADKIHEKIEPTVCVAEKRVHLIIPAALTTAAMLIGFIIEMAWYFNGSLGCVLVGPHGAQVYISVIATFLAAEALLWNSMAADRGRFQPFRCCKSPVPGSPEYGVKERLVGFGYYVALAVFVFICVVGFAAASRWNAFIWALLLLGVCVAAAICSWRFLAAASAVNVCGGQTDAKEESPDVEMVAVAKKEGDGADPAAVVVAKNGEDDEAGSAETPHGGHDDSDGPPKVSKADCCCVCCRTTANSLVFFLTAMLMGGACFEAHGYISYPPDGEYVEITHTRTPSGCEITQRILTKCSEPEGYNSSLPTFFSEVGGGGHSMSDLWGLEDELVNVHKRRYCSYDVPGTAWSDIAPSGVAPDGERGVGQNSGDYLTDLVIEAMGEQDTDFILMGSMDGAYERAQRWAIEHPEHAKAVVPVTILESEFRSYASYWGTTAQETWEYYQGVLPSRSGLSYGIMLFGTNWGLMNVFAPASADYEPQDRAAESIFLNLQNEMQWNTNLDGVRKQIAMTPEEIMADPYCLQMANETAALGIPMLLFNLGRNSTQLDEQCWDPDPLSDTCKKIHADYDKVLELNQDIVDAGNAVNNGSFRLKLCEEECAGQSNAFTINQNSNIPWFAQTMLDELRDMGVDV